MSILVSAKTVFRNKDNSSFDLYKQYTDKSVNVQKKIIEINIDKTKFIFDNFTVFEDLVLKRYMIPDIIKDIIENIQKEINNNKFNMNEYSGITKSTLFDHYIKWEFTTSDNILKLIFT